MTREEMLEEVNKIVNDESNQEKMKQTPLLLSGKWDFQIAFEICRREKIRFGEIKNLFPGITNTVLTSSLRNLEKLGIISRIQYNEMPPRVEYSPTEKGKRLLPVYYELLKWCIYTP